MERSFPSTLQLVLGFLLLTGSQALAQSTAPAPDTAETPPDFPEYIVTPREDLNPYDLSTMEKSQDMDYREGAGTLGTTEKRSGNIEINEALKQRKEEREKAKQKEEEEEQKKSGPEANASVGQPDNGGGVELSGPSAAGDLSSPGVRAGLFTWTDENGVLHVTNDLGQVPMEYQVEALEGSKSLKLDKSPNK
jgi:hypothetical protein